MVRIERGQPTFIKQAVVVETSSFTKVRCPYISAELGQLRASPQAGQSMEFIMKRTVWNHSLNKVTRKKQI